MAINESARAVSLIAGQDLRGDQFELLKIENDNGVGKVIKTVAATDSPVGILGMEPDGAATTDGEIVQVVLLHGIVKVKAGAAITAGQLLVPDTTAGRVAGIANQASLAADTVAVGIALKTAADGEIFEMLAQPMTSSANP